MLFKLKNGRHKDGSKIYVVGDLVRSEVDLDIIFRNKFEKIEQVQVETAPKVAKAEPKLPSPPPEDDVEDDVEEDLEAEVTESSEYGEEVPGNKLSKKADCRMFKKGNWYTLVSATTGEVLNDKKIKKGQVKPFLMDLIAKG